MVSQSNSFTVEIFVCYHLNFDFLQLGNNPDTLDEYERVREELYHIIEDIEWLSFNNVRYPLCEILGSIEAKNDCFTIFEASFEDIENVHPIVDVEYGPASMLFENKEYDLGNGKQCIISSVRINNC